MVDVETRGSAPLTRLRVLAKWFEHPHRLPRFGWWIASRAAGRKGKTKGEFGALLDEARVLLGTTSTFQSFVTRPDRMACEELYIRIKSARIAALSMTGDPQQAFSCRPLWLVEKGLEVHLGLAGAPEDGYRLVAEWAQSSNRSHEGILDQKSCGKLEELLRFMLNLEASEDYPSDYDKD